MKWIKHFTNAHKGSVLQELYAEFGVNTGHGLYWRFLEYVGEVLIKLRKIRAK